MPDINISTGMKFMSFKAFSDIGFSKPVPDTPKEGFKVMINPETFDRTLGVKSEKEKTARSGNSSGHDAGLDSEKYSFDLIFDGTGVAGPKMDGKAMDTYFKTFLKVAYATRPSENDKKKRNYVQIEYCGETFYCVMESMTIHYQLFQADGYPIRIKVNCRYSSVEEPKKEPDAGKASKPKKKKVKNVNKTTPNCECICAEESYEETMCRAQENDSMSMMTCSYPMSTMSTELNYAPVLNYTPVEGYPQ
ncbi:MAG: hypothetical protein IJV54_10540 [Bacteroidales bacterium]|nr:hypothetical protein [Bacteroidales bacterium]